MEVQGEEKKIVFVCSRPPQNVKLGTLTKYGARAVTANKISEKKEKKKACCIGKDAVAYI